MGRGAGRVSAEEPRGRARRVGGGGGGAGGIWGWKKLEAGSRKRRMGIAEVRDWRRCSLRRVEGAREGDEREKGKFRRERREIAACR